MVIYLKQLIVVLWHAMSVGAHLIVLGFESILLTLVMRKLYSVLKVPMYSSPSLVPIVPVAVVSAESSSGESKN